MMPPADPTPPLTAAQIVEVRWLADHGHAGLCEEMMKGLADLLAAHAALTAQLAQRTAEREALRKAVKDGFYEGFALGVWSAADNPRPVDLEADREWNASETKAALAAPTEG